MTQDIVRGTLAESAEAAIVRPIRVFLLDGFDLRSEQRRIPLAPGLERIVAFLAVHNHALKRSYVAGSLWPDVPERLAAASLRSALWRLRSPIDDLIRASGSTIGLGPRVSVDLDELTRLAPNVATSGDPELRDIARAFEGDLLPDWYDDWVILRRERWRQVRLHALEGLAKRLARAGDFAGAAEVALTAADIEPLRESAHRILIEIHLAEGNRAEAIRQYRSYERQMARELGVAPSRELAKLVES